MPKFGKCSLENLSQLDPRLQDVLSSAIDIVDFAIICGYRGQKDQDAAYAAGNSSLKYPESNHNKQPSLAADLIPTPFLDPDDWNDRPRFAFLMGVIKGVANTKGIRVRFGFDWDGDTNWKEHKLQDWPHVELV